MASVTVMKNALTAIIEKGKAGKITPDNYGEDEAALYLKEKALYEAFNKAMDKIPGIASFGPNVIKIAELQEKKQNAKTAASFTAEDQAALDVALVDQQNLISQMDQVAVTNAEEAQNISEALRDAQLAKLNPTGQPGELTYTKPANLADFIVRTQAINPYSRERECDIQFLQMLALAGQQSKTLTVEVLNALKELIKQKLAEL